tara:strand:- start:3162 stop:4235 length:1074 start_codon:yes stop_codon:yes gene_type:complete
MKNFILKTKKSFIICFLLSSVCAFAQTTHTVNNNANTSADFTDLQAAIDAAANGDIIYVQQSATSYGEITINKGLTIIGRSNGDASYKSEVGRIYLDAGASNTTVKGLKISDIQESANTSIITDVSFFDNDITSGIYLGSTDTFNNVLFQGNIIRSSITIYTNTSNVLITNNIILSSALYFYMTDTLLFSNNVFGYYAGVGIYNYASSLLNISNSIFTSNYYGNNITTTLSNQGGGTIQVDNCLTYDYYGSGSNNFSTGAGITINSNVQENIDPLFTAVDVNSSNSIANVGTNNFDPINDDLTLQAGSPVIDDGLFEGYNFKNFGTPTGYPSIKVLANSATVPKNGNLSVTIEAKTN